MVVGSLSRRGGSTGVLGGLAAIRCEGMRHQDTREGASGCGPHATITFVPTLIPDRFVVGANLPWGRYGCDFGANAWQREGGLSANGTREQVSHALRLVADNGGTVVRWFAFCDGRAGLLLDERNHRTTLDGSVLGDLELAFELASRCGVRLLLSLFDFHWCLPPRLIQGVQLGGRRRWWARHNLRHALLQGVVAPVISRFDSHPALWAWEVVNEPEWVTWGCGGRDLRACLSRRRMCAFLDEAVAEIRRHAASPVTVGTATPAGFQLLADLPLDFRQLHWYDRLAPDGPWSTLVGPGRPPVLLGEFPSRASRLSGLEVMEAALGAGYVGALAWSMLAEDPWSDAEQVVSVTRAVLAASPGARQA